MLKTVADKSSTGTEGKLYLAFNGSLITLILLNSGIMSLWLSVDEHARQTVC